MKYPDANNKETLVNNALMGGELIYSAQLRKLASRRGNSTGRYGGGVDLRDRPITPGG